MLPGVYLATKKDGTVYYRSSITYRSKHISLGSFPTEEDAHCAYRCALKISSEPLSLARIIGALPTIFLLRKLFPW